MNYRSGEVKFIVIALTFMVFVSAGGFTDIIQKCIKVSGMKNDILNAILFAMLVRLTLEYTPFYLKILHILYEKLFLQRALKEGQDELPSNVDEITDKTLLEARMKNLDNLITKKYEAYDEMEDGDEKDTELVEINKLQDKLDELSQQLSQLE